MRRARRFFLFVLASVAGVVALLGAAWAADGARHDGKVVRNVSLGGRDVSGLTRDQLAGVVADEARRYTELPVRVEAPGGGFSMAPAEIGLVVDQAATVDAAMQVGRGGAALGRMRDWVASFLDARDAPVAVDVDRPALYRIVAQRDEGRTPPEEPSLKAVRGKLVAVPGKAGRGVDPAAVIEALPQAARDGAPFTVHVVRGPVPPRLPLSEATKAVEAAQQVTTEPFAVTVDTQPRTVDGTEVREWVRTEPTASGTGLRLFVEAEEATTGLARLLADAGTPPVETRFDVVNGAPQIVPGQQGTACCAPKAGAELDRAFQARLAGGPPTEPVALPVKAVDPELTADEAAALGIKEEVGTFTTNFAPNRPRVTNIHRIADLLRGQIIKPGTTFSVNSFVGERTPEKGFVVDAVIEDGKFTESVGGGISQFATTAFNAAFFAGLEFAEYQSHSLYISRYPFGREATLSYPHPDLKLRNPSPYGVLIWPTYTGRSITVTLYSTRFAEVAQTNQTTEMRGPCTRVRTERTRHFLADNTTKVDHVSALYRPEEGVKCT